MDCQRKTLPDFPEVPKAITLKAASEKYVTLTCVPSPDRFYVRDKQMDQMAVQIEDYLRTYCPTAPLIDASNLPLNCLVALCVDEWIRAQVVNVQNDQVKVFYIDYGCYGLVKPHRLRLIPHTDLILNTPQLAIKCQLHNPNKLQEWSPEALESLLFCYQKSEVFKAVIMELAGDAHIVDLRPLEGLPTNQNVFNDLVMEPKPQLPKRTDQPAVAEKSNHANTANKTLFKDMSLDPLIPSLTGCKLHSQRQRLAYQSFTDPDEIKLNLMDLIEETRLLYPVRTKTSFFTQDPGPLKLPDGDTMDIVICQWTMDGLLVCRLVGPKYSESLMDLEGKMADHFCTWAKPQFIELTNVYAVQCQETDKGTERQTFRRVRVIKREKEVSTFLCYQVDHGIHERMSQESLREMDDDLNTTLPYQAIVACLKDSKVPLSFSHTTKCCQVFHVKFQKLLATSCLDLQKHNWARKILNYSPHLTSYQLSEAHRLAFGKPLEDVEEVMQHICGYSFWKGFIEVNLNEELSELPKVSADGDKDDSDECSNSMNSTDGAASLNVISLSSDLANKISEDKTDRGDVFLPEVKSDEMAPGSSQRPSKGSDDNELVGQLDTMHSTDLDHLPHSKEGDHLEVASPGLSQVVKAEGVGETEATVLKADSVIEAEATVLKADSVVEAEATVLKADSVVEAEATVLKADGVGESKTSADRTGSDNETKIQVIKKNADYGVETFVERKGQGAVDKMREVKKKVDVTTTQKANYLSSAVFNMRFPVSVSNIPPRSTLVSKYNFYSYPLFQWTKILVTKVHSPSNFLAIPAALRETLSAMERDIRSSVLAQPINLHEARPYTLYAVRIINGFFRALVTRSYGHLFDVYLPDHGEFTEVQSSNIFYLPPAFHHYPLLAHQMRLPVVPIAHNWRDQATKFFMDQVNLQVVDCQVLEVQDNHSLPPVLVVNITTYLHG